jgi:hypothetical protein
MPVRKCYLVSYTCEKNLSTKYETNAPPERPRPKWEGNIKMDVKETGYALDSSGSTCGPTADSFEHNTELLVLIKGGEFLHKLCEY